jgi:transmembrane sensor
MGGTVGRRRPGFEGGRPMPDRASMTRPSHMDGKAQTSAADWVARLGGEPVESDWLAFEAWLQSAAGHRLAYDKAMALWLDLDRQAAPLAAAIAALSPDDRRATTSRRGSALLWGGAMTAVAAVAVTFAALHPYRSAPATIYSTAQGQRRGIDLADGTRVVLNGASSIAVRLEHGRREVTLAQGEAAFNVVHDANRPFQVKVGDETLRDLGTEFDVLRANGDITVTVRQGLVEVRPSQGRHSLSLGPGSRLQHREGAEQSMVTPVSADDAFAWRTGRLIYRARPLSEVVADLNRYGEYQVRVDGPAAALHFSGVLIIDDQATMVRRLAALLPVSQTLQDGVITLHGVDTMR